MNVKNKKTTIVIFKAITNDGRIVRKSIPIYHDFEEIPSQMFHGVKLPVTTVEQQVIAFLDEQDKTSLMRKYDLSLIIDYYVKEKKHRKNKNDELNDFMTFCHEYIKPYPWLKRPFEAIISEYKDNLFKKGKTNEQKLKEVINIYDIAMKASSGTIDMVLNMFGKTLKIEDK